MMHRTLSGVALLTALILPTVWAVSQAEWQPAADLAAFQEVTLTIEGMECRSCVKDIRKALLRVPGVSSADVRFREGRAVVKYDPQKAGEEELVRAVESASNAMYRYRASVLAHGG